ncbi:MAG: glycoside hydrolase family 3 C-terminal domain-containing protein [Clostridia bacterium]|nr:glycoside hydrolase family 3 C-terminal domain-containing protein [Clostridia bacterium]
MTKADIKKLVDKLSVEQKALMLSGCAGSFTKGFEELGIPVVSLIDGPSSIRRLDKDYVVEGGSPCYPTASTVGATWDKELTYNYAKSLALDSRMAERNVILGPGVNMKRSPFGGRNFEYFSEDPYLSGHLGAAAINGYESEGIGASLKHYAGNVQEFQRLTISAEIDERALREYYLKVYEIVLEHSNPTSVMCAYNKINGIYCAENKWLLNDILREEMGYDGMIVSDWGAVHDTIKSLKAGLDIDMPGNKNIVKTIKRALEAGSLTMDELDASIQRILEFVFKVTDMWKGKPENYSRKQQHEMARQISREGITLLKNDDDVLPVTNKKYKKIAIFGCGAERPTIMGGGSSHSPVHDDWIDKPIDYIRQRAEEEGIEVHYDPIYGTYFKTGYMGAEDIGPINNMGNLGNDYDVMIVFAHDNYGLDVETEYWDRDVISFPNYINGTIESACNACKNVIVIMQTGSAIIPTRWENKVKGIVQMWYSGEGGGAAIADIIFGKANPCSKLAETFPITIRRDMDPYGDNYKTHFAEGLMVGYRYYDTHPEEIWFPFGHGLSYTKYEYSDLKLSQTFADDPDNINIKVSMKVKNVGDMAGKEIVQLYLGQVNPTVVKPVKELRGFEKVALEPGETKEVTFELNKKDFQYYNICLRDWHVESGTYEIIIGASSRDIRLKDEFKIEYENDYTIRKPATKWIPYEED